MTPPLNDIITPTGQRIRSFLPIAGPDGKTTGTLYVEQMEHIGKLAEQARASRMAYLYPTREVETK